MNQYPMTTAWLAEQPRFNHGEPAFTLDYGGGGCGGCNIPFACIVEAQAYATERGANKYTITRGRSGVVVVTGARKDGRHRWNVTRAD